MSDVFKKFKRILKVLLRMEQAIVHPVLAPKAFSPYRETVCRVCQQKSYKVYEATVLKKHTAEYFLCEHCLFLQAERPYWLDEAYKNPVTAEDTGILLRNEQIRKSLSTILFHLFGEKGEFLDYAGGYGFLVRMMRDFGFDFYWYDKYAQNVTAKGFEGNLNKRYSAVTAFEAFEHFEDPCEELERMLALSDLIIFSTETLPRQIPAPSNWWYYCLNHGQHISFYSQETFDFLATKYGLMYYNIKGLHFFSRMPITKECLRKITGGKELKLESKTFSDMQFIIQRYL